MLKKLVIVGIIGFVAVSAIKGSKVGSYLRSEIESLRAKAEAKIPPEKEIQRLRGEVKMLDKDIMAVVNQVAKERVEVAHLKEKTESLRAQQGNDKELLTARAAAIKTATEQVTFGDRTMSIPTAKSELEDGVRRFAENQKSLASLDAALASRVKVRDGLEKQLDAMKNQKSELAAAVDALEAEATILKLQQMENKYQTDDTRLAKIKDDIRELRKKMEIEREKLKLLPAALESPARATSSNKSVDDIMAPLTAAPAKTTGAKVDPKMPIVE